MSAEEPGGRRIADLLASRREQAFVGRQPEVARLRALCAADDVAVVFVHGPGGIGKSMLVRAVTSTIDRRVVLLDGHDTEPTPAAVLAKISEEVGQPVSTPSDLVATGVAEGSVIVFEAYERFGLVDDWIRNELVPALPTSTTTIVVGRNAPNLGWRAPEWQEIVAELVVGPMTETDAAELVRRREVGDPAGKVLRFGRGHPLALELAAAAFRRRPDLEIDAGPPPEVVEELLDVVLADLDPEDRTVVEAAALLRRVTRPMLAALLDVDGAGERPLEDAWRTVRDLPFVTVRSTGLEFNDVVQDVLAAGVEMREPGRVRQLRRRAAEAAIAELERAPGWASTADLLHLVQNPIVRYAFVPPPGLQHTIEVARPSDAAEILAMARDVDGEAAAEVIRRWWEVHPDSFRVLRGDQLRAVAIVRPVDLVDQRAVADPLVAAIEADLRARPLWDGGRALVVRRVLSRSSGERPSREFAAMVIDVKRTYLEMRPRLARVYVNAMEASGLAGTIEPMGFVQLPGVVPVEDRAVVQWSLDFGPTSVDGWLAMHVDLETRPDAPSTVAAADGDSGEGNRADGNGADGNGADVGSVPLARVASLSRREREVLSALAEGLTNRELADRLFISERTANRHLSNIFTKLGVRNRTAAARVALDAGIG